MALLYDYQNGEVLCVIDCGADPAIAVTAAAGLVSQQIPICCTDGSCDYGVDINTGLLYPVLCP